MVSFLDDPPGVVEGAYVRSPGERLIANFQLTQCSALSQLTQLRCRQIAVVYNVGPGVRAYQHHRRAQSLHDVELSLGSVEIARQLFPGDTFEIAKRLKQIDAQPDIAGNTARIARRTIEEEQVVIHDLDTVEMCNGDGFELFGQCPAQ